MRTCLHINTQQPLVCIIYKFTYLHAADPVYTSHAHAACPCLHMYKQQAPIKQASTQAAGSFYIPTPQKSCFHMHRQQVTFVHAHCAGSDFTSTSCRCVYTCTCSKSHLHMNMQQVPFTHEHAASPIYI